MSDFSPPDMSIIFVMRLPRGCAVTSTPVFSKSSGSTSVSSAEPPGNSTANISLKFLFTASKVRTKSSFMRASMTRTILASERRAPSRSESCAAR